MDIQLITYRGRRNVLEKTWETADVITISGSLRGDCDVLNPVIEVSVDNPFIYNYAYIPDFKRYYFIDRFVVSRQGLYRLYMSVDVLQSFQGIIEITEGYVRRSQYAEPSRLVDERIMCSEEPIIDFVEGFDNMIENYTENVNDMCYILTVAVPPMRSGSITLMEKYQPTKTTISSIYSRSYILSYEALCEFVDKCWGNNNVIEYFKSIFVDFAEGVINVIALPFKLPNVLLNYSIVDNLVSTDGAIWVGPVTLTLDNKSVRLIKNMPYLEFKGSYIDITPRYNSFLDYEPYTKVQVFLPYLGYVDLDADVVMGKRVLAYYYVDYTTGTALIDVQVRIPEGDSFIYKTINIFDTTVGTSVSISRTNITDRRNQMLQAGIKFAGGMLNAKNANNLQRPLASDILSMSPTKFSEAQNAAGIKNSMNKTQVITQFAVDMVRANRVHIMGGQSSNELVWNYFKRGIRAIIDRPRTLDSVYSTNSEGKLELTYQYRRTYGVPDGRYGYLLDLFQNKGGYIEFEGFYSRMANAIKGDHDIVMTQTELFEIDSILRSGFFYTYEPF
jgi:hypothetical protein